VTVYIPDDELQSCDYRDPETRVRCVRTPTLLYRHGTRLEPGGYRWSLELRCDDHPLGDDYGDDGRVSFPGDEDASSLRFVGRVASLSAAPKPSWKNLWNYGLQVVRPGKQS
jgi:hypothetical protein